MTLKTLKDIDRFEVEQITKYISVLQKADCFKPKEKKEVIAWLTHQMKLFDLIKQEAIKWVKDAQINRDREEFDTDKTYWDGFKWGLIHFHNITKEDLK